MPSPRPLLAALGHAAQLGALVGALWGARLAAPALVVLALVPCPRAQDAGTPAPMSSPPRRPHVLLIAVDDLRPELSCLGSTWVETPHMDRLAAGGVVFRNHFAQVPTCGASRFALLTGASPARSGVTSGNTAFYQGAAALSAAAAPIDGGADAAGGAAEDAAGAAAAARTLPELFRRAGWRTLCVGKVSHTPDGRVFAYDGSGDGRPELPDAWDELATPFGPWGRGWGAFFGYAGGRHREDGSGYAPLTEFVAERDDDLPDGLIAARAVELLGRLAEDADQQPFFLALGFSKPHLPFVATASDRAAVEQWDVTAAPHPDAITSAYTHGSGEFFRYQRDFERAPVLDEGAQVEARAAYAACVRFVDRQVGRVLDAVDDLGLADDTIVVLWSDHGWHLGDSALWGKHTPFERALRCPLIVRAPGLAREANSGLASAEDRAPGVVRGAGHERPDHVRAGHVCDALVESLDVFPTLVELALGTAGAGGLPLTPPFDGQSLVPLLTGEADGLRDTALSFWGDAVSLRSPTHRLIARRGRDGAWREVELYAVAEGDDPLHDQASSEPELREELLAALEQRLADG